MDAKIPRRVMTMAADLCSMGAQALLANDKGTAVLVMEWDDGSTVIFRDGKARGDGEVCLELEKALQPLQQCQDSEISVTLDGKSATLFPCAVVPLKPGKSQWRSRLKTLKAGLPGIPPSIHAFLMGALERWLCTKQHGSFVLVGTIDKGRSAVYVHDQTDDAVIVLPLGGKAREVPAWLKSL